MNKFMNRLYQRFETVVTAQWLTVVINVIIYANPIAILPQLISALTAQNVEGISLSMWYIFGSIQAAFIFQGIKTKTSSIFFSMLISMLESIAIIIIVYIRS